MREILGILFTLFLFAGRALADEPVLPVIDDRDPNSDPAFASATMGALATMSGDSGTKATPTAYVEADAPIAIGKRAFLRAAARVGLTALPGETVDLSSVETFKAAEVAFSAYRIVGTSTFGERRITTAVIAEWGFTSRLPSGDLEPEVRLSRHYGGGVRITEVKSGAGFTVLYGRDESAGDRGWGQWIVYGQLPIPLAKGPEAQQALSLVVDGTLSVGPRNEWLKQRDVLRVGLVVNVGSLISALKQ